MRRLDSLLVLLAAAIAAIGPVNAVCPRAVLPGDGSISPNARAPMTRYVYARQVYLINPSEMGASGLLTGPITAIGWSYSTGPGLGLTGPAPLKIYLQNTSDTTNTKSTTWSTAIVGMTLVHSAGTNLPDVSGKFTVGFSGGAPFSWTGGGVYVAFDWGPYTGPLSTTCIASCNSTGLTSGLYGAQSNTSPPNTLAVSNFRPETHLIGTVPSVDLSVNSVGSMAALPLGLSGADTIRTKVSQYGDTQPVSAPVTLNISGPETFTDTVMATVDWPCTVNPDEPGDVIDFVPFTPSLLGTYFETISVPGDAVPANNSLTRSLDVTQNRYSYIHAGLPSAGGFGFDSTGELVARFSLSAPTQVDAVDVPFSWTSTTTYRVVIRGVSVFGEPGPLLYLDAADRTVTVTGDNRIVLPAPVPVPVGDIFVGIRQTNTVFAGLSIFRESPPRVQRFYANDMPDNIFLWDDVAFSGYHVGINVGVVLGACLADLGVDVAPTGVTQLACGGTLGMATTPVGGTPPFRYQWTENGLDIPGATASTYAATKSGGRYVYNVKISDAGGCVDAMSSDDLVGVWGPAAVVSGDATVCGGGSVVIQAALTGTAPWSLNWSDGFIQNGVITSPATRTVAPASTTVYTVAALTDSVCAGSTIGSATVAVAQAPGETAADGLPWSGTTQLDWTANPAASSYTLYRGTSTDLPSLLTAAIDSCTQYVGTATSVSGLVEVPAPGIFFWYLVTSSAGICEGTPGAGRTVNSSGACP